MKIRRFEERDRQRLHEITANSFRDASVHGKIEALYGKLRGTTWADRKMKDIDLDIETEPEGVLVAEIDGRVVGYITTTTDDDSGVGRIPNLAVDADYQGQGIGKALINAALDRFEQRGMEYAKIETLVTNERGGSLYPKAGFQEIMRQIHYFMRMEDRKRL
ncbi:MAG TPA: GNAT family N-acetyltransferase [Armatimonadota bacterium]|nr:GNAT family N-acetyltransferase [Armatimonadota bacterium]